MHLFHISQVVFIIPRIRPGDKHVTAHRISILSRAPPLSVYIRERRAHLLRHLHTRQLRHLNFSRDKVGPKSHSETNYRAKCDAFQAALTYSRPPCVFVYFVWMNISVRVPPSGHCPTFRVICDISDERRMIRGKAACSA